MTRITSNQKVRRTLRFMLGLRQPNAHRPLAAYGLTQQELSTAAQYLRAATEPLLNQPKNSGVSPALLAELDAVDNHWFPIIKYSLTRYNPKIAEWTFLNLTQGTGHELLVSLPLLFSRVDALADGSSPFGEDGKGAFQVLQTRGLDDATRTHISELIQRAEQFAEAPPFDTAAHEAAINNLWAWYLEWSGIARTVIKNRSVLRSLGFRKNSTAVEEEEASDTVPVTASPSATTVLPSGAALPTLSSGSAAVSNGASNGALSNGAASGALA